MLCNYHTHTKRCGHAKGTEREYVESAIRAGIKILGFADHVPTPPYTPEIPQFRMTMAEAEDYAATINKLKDEYKNDIELHIGFEAEYIPMVFDKQIEMLNNIGCEYLILGQHFLVYPDSENVFVNWPNSTDVSMFRRYVDLVEEGVLTGKYSYICHPDCFSFEGDHDIWVSEYKRLCDAAKKMDIPLEFNMQSFRDQKGCPTNGFYQFAKEQGNKLIIGYDAHHPWLLDEPEWLDMCIKYIDNLGAKRLETLNLRPIK